MQVITSPVHTLCLGHCESMAAVLLATGAPGERSVMPNARVMIHQPFRGASGNARQLSIHAASIERSRQRIAGLLAERAGRSQVEIEALIEYDHVCDASEAIALGLADRVVGAGELTTSRSSTSPPADMPERSATSAPPKVET